MKDLIPTRLLHNAEARGHRPGYYVRESGSWKMTTWKDFVEEVKTAARALVTLGLAAEGTVCLLGFNRPEWVIFDHACMMAGGAPAGIYTTCSPNEVQYIIGHAESKIILLEDEAQWAKVKAERENLPNLEHVVMMKGCPSIDDPLVMSWEKFMAKAEGTPWATIEARLAAIKPEQLATFIYTSGTTGPPKAVMLSHENLAWTSKTLLSLVTLGENDHVLSYLPLSHIAEQVVTIHGPATGGAAVYYAESIVKLPDNLKEVQPSLMFGVPRIWEKFHTGISGKLKLATGAKKKLVDWARKVGTKVSAARNTGQEPKGLLALQYKLANKLVFSKLKAAIGLANAKTCVSGAAPIAPEVLEFFASLDIVVSEIYGQSEDCGPTTFNRPGAVKYGTVGQMLPGVKVKIAADGEILVKGPNVFLGYYKDQAATDETLEDGWLHSGDLGSFDDQGFLSITGRKKDIIITAGGKNITPKNIESALTNIELVGQAVVIGDRRKFLSALLTIDEEAGVAYAEANAIPVETLHENPKVRAMIEEAVEKDVNALFARVEHVRKFTILHRPFTIEDGELTPTLKIKRRMVNQNFADQIEAMYQD